MTCAVHVLCTVFKRSALPKINAFQSYRTRPESECKSSQVRKFASTHLMKLMYCTRARTLYGNCTLFNASSEQLSGSPFLELRCIENDGKALEQRNQQQRERCAEQVEHIHKIVSVAEHEQNSNRVGNQSNHACK